MEAAGGAIREGGRAPDAMRPVEWQLNPAPQAGGSVLIKVGQTQVLCAASMEDRVPRWMMQQKCDGGWLTAEYSMMPYASLDRKSRESSLGRIGGRTHEIQRLIGRSMRAVVDLTAMERQTIWLDCDVIQADGGTRTAAITGSYVALNMAVKRWLDEGRLRRNPVREAVAAISMGLVNDQPLLDLCYEEDVQASVDMNVVMTASGKFVELQGTAESAPFARNQLDSMLGLAEKGIRELLDLQRDMLRP